MTSKPFCGVSLSYSHRELWVQEGFAKRQRSQKKS